MMSDVAETGWQSCYTCIDAHVVALHADVAAGRELQELQVYNLLRVQYGLVAPDADGLPQERDAEVIAELRRELDDWIRALGGRLVAESSGAGQHSWYFYVACGWLEAANLVHRIGLRRNVVLGVEMMADAAHRIYHEVLMPAPEDVRRTHIARRLAELAAQGDDGRQPRPVTHEVRFDNRTQALACADWARRNGFVTSGLLPPTAEQEGYRLIFHRVMEPDAAALDAEVAQVAAAAQRLGGAHVGWRVEACLPQSA